MKRTILAAALLGTLALPAAGDWLVTRDGARIELRGGFKIQGKTVTFTRADGKLESLRLTEVDLPASEQATAAGNAAATAPVPPPAAAGPAKPRRVVTDKDLRPTASAAAGQIAAYPVPGHGRLQLTIPRGWTGAVSQPSGDLPPTITFSSSADREPKLLLTALWSPTGDPAFNSGERIRGLLPEMGRKYVETSVEKQIRLTELRVPSGVGYWFSLTDTAPKPGEYEHMSQGAIPAGELLLSFTILSHTAPPEGIQGILGVLGTAEQKK